MRSESSSIRMYFPRRATPVIIDPLSLRLKREGDDGAINFGSLISLATIVRPTTARQSARTTCSTSGSSGILQEDWIITSDRQPPLHRSRARPPNHLTIHPAVS